MKAVVQTGIGGYEVLAVQERPAPAVGPGSLRIAVAAAGLNFADTMARAGLYPDAPKPPAVLGYEVAGTVESVGDGVEGWQVGERVIAPTRFGGQAEFVVVPAADVMRLPERLSFEQGAAIPVAYGTAYAALFLLGGLQPGDRLLIHAAAGGVGIAATQLAAARGAEIFGTASAEKHAAIRAQGVSHAIDYRGQDFAAEVRRLTGGEGVDLIIDAQGPASFRRDYRLLRQGGTLVMFGISESSSKGRRDLPALLRSLATMPLATLPWWKSLMVMNENKGVAGLNMLSWWDREGSLERLINPLAPLLDDGTIDPVVAASLPFERAGEAHALLAERRNIGKVVLTP